ncbi:carbon-nitrogen hydrolase family protein [Solitalea sp. MAHUQ-68]|uniref:Carbon-nitrogen hydrolase family protein n=1 Tax=Solitalea agri TaxID=2953739 RepID=A0A9X2F395_9SPHI|nr:carbon-nitrogen hydrolase family protein [Solitalea agri]MCO4293969.1 carbon-nitrogen hydrolase family protein [Solitalea agri]
MKLRFTKIALFIVLLIFGFQLWSQSGRVKSETPSADEITLTEEKGTKSSKGNLLGIQPYLYPSDYANEKTFYNKLSGYLKEAQKKDWLTDNTIVVFPEYIGTWLVASNEKSSVYSASTVTDAMTTIILTHPLNFVKNYFSAPANDKAKYAVFAMKSEEMAGIYERCFSQLAKEYNVTIVGGSIVLPEPIVHNGHLRITKGSLYNVCGIFTPNGELKSPLVKKTFPVDEEKAFTCSGRVENIPVFQTDAGKLGVVICADSWYPKVYETLKQQKADLIAIPSYSAPNNIWSSIWQGYNGGATPSDINKNDLNEITERDAWLKYSMGGRAARAGISNGINVFLRGKLWDLGSDGSTIYLKNDTLGNSSNKNGASIVNIWL